MYTQRAHVSTAAAVHMIPKTPIKISTIVLKIKSYTSTCMFSDSMHMADTFSQHEHRSRSFLFLDVLLPDGKVVLNFH